MIVNVLDKAHFMLKSTEWFVGHFKCHNLQKGRSRRCLIYSARLCYSSGDWTVMDSIGGFPPGCLASFWAWSSEVQSGIRSEGKQARGSTTLPSLSWVTTVGCVPLPEAIIPVNPDPLHTLHLLGSIPTLLISYLLLISSDPKVEKSLCCHQLREYCPNPHSIL